jgi:hypothetical protein
MYSNYKIKIVYPLNFATSFYFLWTFMHAWARDCPLLMVGCFICLCTSVLYYSTNNAIIRKIDMFCCQFSAVYFMFTAMSMSYSYLGATICFITSIRLYTCKNTEIRHSILHFISNVGISFIIEASTPHSS